MKFRLFSNFRALCPNVENFNLYHLYTTQGLEVYKRAKIVWVGETPKYQFVHDPQLKFSVDKNLTGLQQYLAKRNITMETFANVLVTGQETSSYLDTPAKSIPAGPPLMAASDLRGQGTPSSACPDTVGARKFKKKIQSKKLVK